MGLDEGTVLFSRVGKGLTLFSMEPFQDLDFSILCELAGLPALVLPKSDVEIYQVGLALSRERVGNQAQAAAEPYRSDGTDTASLLVNSLLEYQERPFMLLHRLSGHPDEVWCTSFSHDGTMLAVSGKGGDIFIYNTSNYATPASRVPLSFAVNNITWSPDDSKILATCEDNTARIWDNRVNTNCATWNDRR